MVISYPDKYKTIPATRSTGINIPIINGTASRFIYIIPQGMKPLVVYVINGLTWIDLLCVYEEKAINHHLIPCLGFP
jgi:hypothetical protein